MIRAIIYLFPIMLSAAALAQVKPVPPNARLSPGAALLFGGVKSNASVAEKNEVFKGLALALGADKKSFESDGSPVDAKVYPTDINGDGQEELFVVMGSVALYGNTGQGFELHMRDKSGKLKLQPDISGTGIPLILTVKNLGYPDILLGGPGFEHPVYRWNGNNYTMNRKVKDGAPSSKHAIDVESSSKSYTSSR